MLLETRFDDEFNDYCKLCEWNDSCIGTRVCQHFTPYDWSVFELAEIIDDQNMRQAEYLKIMAEFGGEC